MIYKTQKVKHRATLTSIETAGNSGAPEGFAVSASLVTPVVLLLTDSGSTNMEMVLDTSMCK